MKHTSGKLALLTGIAVASIATASNAAITYLSTNFDEVGVATGNLPATSNPTGLMNTSDNANNVTVVANYTTVAVDIEPSGQHLRIVGNQNKHVTMENAMTLATDSTDLGFDSFTVSFSYLLTGGINNNRLRILYSSSGNFNDTVLLRDFVITGSTLVDGASTIQTVVTENVWNQISFDVSNTDVTFSDTAKFRFAQDTGGSFDSASYLDDIVISAIPEPSTALLGSLGLLALLRRRR
ncbi:MAG: PEP-CTERM sorting domain-containing protein [Luteolibacter sp.]